MKSMLTAVLLTLLPLQISLAETAEVKGLAIAIEADKRDTGFGDSTANLVMVLSNNQGQSSTRYLSIQTLEVDGDGDKSLSIFDKPLDIKGTALLSFSHKTGTDDQWLYLPALKRVKRISSSNKSGAFVGSEFAYEDLSSQEVEKYTYKYLKDETYNGLDCFVLERDPVDENSGYSRQVVWLDKAEYRAQKIDFYDRKNTLLKTLLLSEYNQYLNKFWRAHKYAMQNHQTGKRTELSWSDFQFKTGLTDRDFDQSTLKRVR